MSRFKFAAFTWFSSTGLSVITLFTSLISAPYLLRWLGKLDLGAFKTLTEIVAFVALIETGISGGISPLMATYLGKEDKEAQQEVLVLGLRVYAIVAAVCMFGGLALLPVIQYLIPVGIENVSDLRGGFAIALAGFVLMPFAPLRYFLEARQRGFVVNILLALQFLLTTAVALLLAFRGFGISGQAIALLSGSILFCVIILIINVREFPHLLASLFTRSVRPELKSGLWRLGGASFIASVCGRVSLYIDSILVASMIGTVVVVPFAYSQRLISVVQSQLFGLTSSSWAGMAELYARNQQETMNFRLLELTKTVTVLGCAALGPVVAYNHSFVALWLGHENYAGETLTVLAAVNSLLWAIFVTWGTILNGTGHARDMVPMFVAQAVINVGSSVALTRTLGFTGPLWGTFISFMTITIWGMPLLIRRRFGISIASLAKTLVLPLALGLAHTFVCWRIAHSHAPYGWPGLCAEMATAAVVYLVMAYVFLYDKGERSMWAQRIKKILFPLQA